MKMLLQRTHMTEAGTFGKLFADDTFLCYTLEDPVREIEGQPVATWKIKGKTAIPQGTYRITLEISARFGPETLTVNAVPGFEGVRMHAGNVSGQETLIKTMEVNPTKKVFRSVEYLEVTD